MIKRKWHVYINNEETHRRVGVSARQLVVTITDLVTDCLNDLLEDVELVPPGVTGSAALKFLRDLRRRRRERKGQSQDASMQHPSTPSL